MASAHKGIINYDSCSGEKVLDFCLKDKNYNYTGTHTSSITSLRIGHPIKKLLNLVKIKLWQFPITNIKINSSS